MTEVMLLISQISSLLTFLIAIIALILLSVSLKKLSCNLSYDRFSIIIFFAMITFSSFFLGVTAMAFYHFIDFSLHPKLGDIIENAGYIFIFIGVIISIIQSWIIINFGKSLLAINTKKKRR